MNAVHGTGPVQPTHPRDLHQGFAAYRPLWRQKLDYIIKALDEFHGTAAKNRSEKAFCTSMETKMFAIAY